MDEGQSIIALVIDDNAQNRKVLSDLLTEQGITVIEVGDPTTILGVLQKNPRIDLAFVDLSMPHLPGFSVKDILKSRHHQLRIIAYSAHIEEMSVARGLGFSGFLGKPLDDRRFPDQLARILRNQPVWER
jgi:CheY-like chemotaxis protein